MPIKYVFFDLDGTLLPMDERFNDAYFGGLCKKMAPHGYEPKELIATIWAGVKEMVKNDGSRTNEDVFWGAFEKVIGKNAREDEPYFAAFYEEDFDSIAAVCPRDPRARLILDMLHEKKIPAVLATNPVFPVHAMRFCVAMAGKTGLVASISLYPFSLSVDMIFGTTSLFPQRASSF